MAVLRSRVVLVVLALLATASGKGGAGPAAGQPALDLKVRTDRFVYAPGAAGTAVVTVVNAANMPLRGTLRPSLHSGLDAVQALPDVPVTVDGGARADFALEFRAPPAAGGAELRCTLMAGDREAGAGRECFLATDDVAAMSHLVFHTAFDASVMDPAQQSDGGAAEAVRGIRAACAGVVEQFCYAPDDFALHAPDFDRWYSGQTMYTMSKHALRTLAGEAHRQGMVALAYGAKWVYGPYGFELARRHPDWFYWDSNWYGSVWNVRTLKRWTLPIPVEEQSKLGQPGLMSITPLVTLPEVAAHGIDQFRRSMRMFGFDGVRLDSDGWNAAVVRNADPANAFGRKAYPADCTDPDTLSARLVGRIRSELAKDFPRFIYGDNVGWWWASDLAQAPRKYLEEAKDGGLVMEEGFNNRVHPEKGAAATWQELLSFFTTQGLNVRRAGGYPYVIGIGGAPNDSVADGRALLALSLACGVHSCSRASDYLMDYMRFSVRHAGLLYDRDLAVVTEPAKLGIAVAAKGPVWWEPLVRARPLPDGRGQVLVHLINAPRHERFNQEPAIKMELPNQPRGEGTGADKDLDEWDLDDKGSRAATAAPASGGAPRGAAGKAAVSETDPLIRAAASAGGQPFECERQGVWRLGDQVTADGVAAAGKRMPPPPLQGNVRVRLSDGAGLRAKRAVLLSPDAAVPGGELPLTPVAGGVQVTVPVLSLWSVVVFEGEATASLPRRTAFVAPRAPSLPESAAVSAKLAASGGAPQPEQDTWRYWPGANLDNTFANKDPFLVAPDVVADPDARAGEAVLLNPGQEFNWRMVSLPPGKYRLTLRAKAARNDGLIAFSLGAHHIVSLTDESQRYSDTWLTLQADAFKAANAYQDFTASVEIKPPWHAVFAGGHSFASGKLWIERLELKCIERMPEPKPAQLWRVEAAGAPDAGAGDGQVAAGPDGGCTLESEPLPPGRYRVVSRVKRAERSQDNLFGDVGGYGGGFLGLQASSFTIGVYEEIPRRVDLLSYGSVRTVYNGIPGLVVDRMDVQLLERFTEQQVLARTKAPRSERRLLPRPGLQVWLAEGLFAREAGIPDALAAGKAEVTAAWLSSAHGTYRLEGDVPRKFLLAGQDADIEDALADDAARPAGDAAPPVLDAATDKAQAKTAAPRFDERLLAYDVVVLHDIPASTLDIAHRALLQDFVHAGGGLLVTGGMFGLDRGGWQQSDLVTEILPVALSNNGTLTQLEPPPRLSTGSDAAVVRGLDFPAGPLVRWAHRVTPKPGARVELAAGDLPVLITWSVGKGRVAVVAAPPYGEAPPGQALFWDCPAWRTAMARTIAWLGGEK